MLPSSTTITGIAHALADWASLGVEVDFFDPVRSPRAELPEALAGFDTLVLMRERTAFPREVLERLPDLELRRHHRDAQRRARHRLPEASAGVRVCGTGIPGYGGTELGAPARASPARSRSPGR